MLLLTITNLRTSSISLLDPTGMAFIAITVLGGATLVDRPLTSEQFSAIEPQLKTLAAAGHVTYSFESDAGSPGDGTITAAGQALIDDADAAAQRATLGLGSAATQNLDSIQGPVVINVPNADDTPLLLKIAGVVMFTLNKFGLGLGDVAPNGLDDWMHIERNHNGATGPLIFNRTEHVDADTFIHLYAGGGIGGTPPTDFRQTCKPAVAGGQFNETARCVAWNQITLTASPFWWHPSGLPTLNLSAAGDMTLQRLSSAFVPIGIAGPHTFAVKNPNASALGTAVLRVDSDGPNFGVTVCAIAGGGHCNVRFANGAGALNIIQAANNHLGLYTFNIERVRVLNTGFVGIGTAPASAHSHLTVSGSVSMAITTTPKTTAYVVAATDNTVTYDATSGVFNTTLPTAVGIAGRLYTLIKVDVSANAVTVVTTSSQTINGAANYSLSAQWKRVTVQSDGANWLIKENN